MGVSSARNLFRFIIYNDFDEIIENEIEQYELDSNESVSRSSERRSIKI